jgi:hypothetical protein
MSRERSVAAEKTPSDPYLAAVDLLRLERALRGLELRIEAVRDRQITFPSELTKLQLDRLVAEHEAVSAVIDELRAVAT